MSISSLSFNAATRATIMRLQTELKDANTELSSGRYADVGLTLGRLSGEAVQYHSQETSIQKMLDSNKLVTSRLEVMSDTLDGVRTSAQSMMTTLTTLASDVGNSVAVKSAQDTAASALSSMIGALNVNVTGQFLFAGAQTDQTPMQDASSKVAANFQGFLDALSADKGTTVTAATISAEDLKSYLSADGHPLGYKFDDSFDDESWADWSNASDTPIVSRISKTETIESSLSTDASAFRKIAAAYSLMNSIGLENMSSAARKEVADAALSRINAGIDGTTALEAQVGTRLNRVSLADTTLATQKTLVQNAIDRLEGVDATEAGLRVTALETQLQASYTVTGRLQNLSLLNYL
ncbi:flagellar hook-associated family protein [Aureimonas flava]|uniref:Flagellin n=1 Tax=Aureimonas flava TaxID=2320271 RepID=A0A3A1WMR9_9HYPH|nr:flagellar hook-associated family protein [Aureimonas flava]RIY01884.1 flagellar hook-associated family protein [Aureimonas flava]